jgi:PPOX class probable F420-dependent enzyme
MRAMLLGASNSWFAVSRSALSLPRPVDPLAQQAALDDVAAREAGFGVRLALVCSGAPVVCASYEGERCSSGQDTREMHDKIVGRRRVAGSGVARLATLDVDGRPHLVPIAFVLDGDTLYSAVDAKPKRSRTLRRIENARRRPDVTVLVDNYDDDWTRLWWVRLRGRARVLEGGAEARRALELLTAKYEQYREVAPGLPVLAVDIQESRVWGPGEDLSPRGSADRRDL